jgi:hypothetical protein
MSGAPPSDDGGAPPEKKPKARTRKVTVEVDDDTPGGGEGATITRTAGDREIPNAGSVAWQPIFSDFADPTAVAVVRVTRTWPKEPPLGGMIGEFPADMTEENIRQRAGGGSYDCTAVNRMGRPLARKIVAIAGRPKIPADDLDPYPAPGAPAANSQETARMLERVIELQAKSTDAITKIQEDARANREREFRDFQLLMKQENAHTLTMLQEGHKATMQVVTEANKTSMASLSAGFGQMMEFAAKIQAPADKGGGMDIKETLEFAEKLAMKMGSNSPWQAIATMAPHLMPPRAGTPEWFFAQGRELPPAMMRAIEAQAGGGRPNPSTSSAGASTGGGASTTSERGADAPADGDEIDDDPIGMFLDWIGQTPDRILAHALMARLEEGTIPKPFVEAMDQAIRGDEGPIGAMLTEYGALDLAPRLRAAAALMLQAAAAAKQ